jgi:hypothetical protein
MTMAATDRKDGLGCLFPVGKHLDNVRRHGFATRYRNGAAGRSKDNANGSNSSPETIDLLKITIIKTAYIAYTWRNAIDVPLRQRRGMQRFTDAKIQRREVFIVCGVPNDLNCWKKGR